ncbi:hypothetical protein SBV45_04660 [Chlamydia crocodili]|uniref:hypothetical protein n=1 Tax=Chlamydia TaxID=810 RepID=UPI002FCBDADC
MKDKIDNNYTTDLSSNTSRTRATTDPDPSLFTLTGTTITSMKTINMNNQNISGLPEPRQDSDAVSLDYLKSNYVSKSDPQSGYLPTTGGTMTGNIDMSGHSIINVKMPEKAPGSTDLNPSAAATVKYVMDTATTVTNNPQINDAVNKISEVSTKVSTIEAALGLTSTNNPDPDAPPPPDTSLFVKIEGSTMTGDLDMSQRTVKGLGTPTDPKDAVNVEYLQARVTTPQIGLLGNTISTSTTVTGDFDWKTAATPSPTPALPSPSPSVPTSPLPKPSLPQPIRMGSDVTAATTTGPTATPKTDNIITTPVTEQYLKIEDSDTKTIKVLAPGIVTLSVTANWSGGSTANIGVILNPSTTTTSGSSSGSSSSATPSNTDTVIYSVAALSSGQNLFCQIPVQNPSDLKLKFTPPTTGGSGSGGNDLTVTSWSWQATLLPSTFPTTSSPSTP